MGRRSRGSSTGRRNATTMLLLSVLLAVVAAGYALLPSLFPEEQQDDASTSLLGVTEDEIEQISWEGDAGTGSIQRAETDDDEEESTWTSPDEPDVELDSELCDELAAALADAVASREISSDEVTDEMGLDEPDVTVEVSLSDETTVPLALSDPTDEGSTCYARVDDGSSGAFLLSSSLVETFAITVADLYALESSPSAYGIVDLTIESAAGTFSLTYVEGGDETLSYSTEYEWFAAWGDDTPVAIDEEDANSLTGVVNYLEWASCVDPTYDGTTDYGFNDPTLTATLNYTKSNTENMGDTDGDGVDDYETVTTEGTFTLIVGDQAEDGSYYAQPEGSTKVYTISADDVGELLGASVEDMLPDDVVLMDWDTVESIDVAVDGETTTIELVRDESSDDASSDDTSSESESDEDEARADSYLVDGEEADANAVEALLDAIDALASEDETQDGASEAAELTIVFHRSTEASDTVTLSFARFDTSYYLSDLDGDAHLLVNKNDIANLKDLVDAL